MQITLNDLYQQRDNWLKNIPVDPVYQNGSYFLNSTS